LPPADAVIAPESLASLPRMTLCATAPLAEICAVPPLSTRAAPLASGTPRDQFAPSNQSPVVPAQIVCAVAA